VSELNHRARRILAAVVNEYLNTGEAVGSRTVTRRYGIDLSPATVRNVMSDLEEAGLLKQPHTSAGRVPTDQGLRFFVDSLLKVHKLNPKERDELSSRYAIPQTDDLEGALRETSRVLAELSHHTVVVVTPRSDVDVLEHLEFVRLRDNQLLAVIVTRSGQVHNKIVHTAENVAPDELERVNNYLNDALGGLTLEGVVARVRSELASERTQYDELQRRALTLSAEALPPVEARSSQVIIEGQGRLVESLGDQVDPEQIQRMKNLFRALEAKQHLVELLEETAKAPGIRVFIGAETQIEELKDFTLVTATYGASEVATGNDGGGDVPLGTLGVIGPTRMNYSRVINLVDFTAQLVSGVIRKR
jgi:heat-inducible transcriptional repressor